MKHGSGGFPATQERLEKDELLITSEFVRQLHDTVESSMLEKPSVCKNRAQDVELRVYKNVFHRDALIFESKLGFLHPMTRRSFPGSVMRGSSPEPSTERHDEVCK